MMRVVAAEVVNVLHELAVEGLYETLPAVSLERTMYWYAVPPVSPLIIWLCVAPVPVGLAGCLLVSAENVAAAVP